MTEIKPKYDLSTRLYPITELIQRTAVKRRLTVACIREEICEEVKMTSGMLSQLENAHKGQKKPARLQLYQEIRFNAYFKKHLEEDIHVMQLEFFTHPLKSTQ